MVSPCSGRGKTSIVHVARMKRFYIPEAETNSQQDETLAQPMETEKMNAELPVTIPVTQPNEGRRTNRMRIPPKTFSLLYLTMLAILNFGWAKVVIRENVLFIEGQAMAFSESSWVVVSDVPLNPVWEVLDSLQSWIDLQSETKNPLGRFGTAWHKRLSGKNGMEITSVKREN